MEFLTCIVNENKDQEKKTKKDQQREKYQDRLIYSIILIACVGFILIFPLRLGDAFIRWPIFVVVSFIALILIDMILEPNSKGIYEKRAWLGIVLFVLFLFLCGTTTTYRLEKGYVKNGVFVDAEIIDFITAESRYGRVIGWELRYCILVDNKHNHRWAAIDKYDFNHLYIGDSIPVIYNSRHPKVSRLDYYETSHKFNLFLTIENIFHKHDSIELNKNI